MTIQVNYSNFSTVIRSAKFEIEKGVYQIVEPVVKKSVDDGVEVTERYVEISIEDERLSSVVSKKYTRKELLELIQLYQKLSNQIATDIETDCK